MTLPIALILALTTAPLVAQKSTRPAAVRVFVTTAQPADAAGSDEEKGRLEAVAIVQELLKDKSQFALVRTAAEAQVVVEVLNREERGMAEGGFGGASLTKFRQTIVRTKVSAGADQSELKGVGQGSWKSAAKDLVERLSKWVTNHVMPTFS